MRRTLLVLVLIALALPAVASGHGSLDPTATSLGASQRFVLTIANTLAGGPGIVGVEVSMPDGVTVESAEGRQPRWQVEVSGTTITWRGGPVEGLAERFAFTAKMPEVEGPLEFRSRELYVDGGTPPFALPVVVTQFAAASPGTEAAPDAPSSGGGDGLAWFAIALAATALLLALGALLVAVSIRSRLRAPATDAS